MDKIIQTLRSVPSNTSAEDVEVTGITGSGVPKPNAPVSSNKYTEQEKQNDNQIPSKTPSGTHVDLGIRGCLPGRWHWQVAPLCTPHGGDSPAAALQILQAEYVRERRTRPLQHTFCPQDEGKSVMPPRSFRLVMYPKARKKMQSEIVSSICLHGIVLYS